MFPFQELAKIHTSHCHVGMNQVPSGTQLGTNAAAQVM
jgi:hypothetical protein